jgi:acyl-CoA synthetase (NDP forming)
MDSATMGEDLGIKFRSLFVPLSIAVVGASATGITAGNRFIRTLKEAAYPGQVFPIHPSASEIEGFRVYPSIEETPSAVDYAYLTVPAEKVESILDVTPGKIGFAQIMASGSPDMLPGWEDRLRHLSRKTGVRLIGPNCMGTHSPLGGYTFIEGARLVPGKIGIACQSGGLGMDILLRGQNLGLSFSGLVTLGNSIDVEPTDLFEYYLSDPVTHTIGFYVEDIKDGRRFFELARRNCGRKPVVLLVGGLSALGQKAASSHTGAMGGSRQAWEALARQTGALLTTTLDAFLDALQLCSWLHPQTGDVQPTITLCGNGGGTSVLAADALEAAGFGLAMPNAEARQSYATIEIPPGASLENPIDLPASVLKEDDGRLIGKILDIDLRCVAPYATIIHLNLTVLLGYRHIEGFLPNLMQAITHQQDDRIANHKLLVLRSDRREEVDHWRRQIRQMATDRGIPTFDEIPQAVDALKKYRDYERFLTKRRLIG